jgi:hypothetical protein
VSIRDEGRGGGGAPTAGPSGGAYDATRPGDRARANLALLYGGAGRGAIGRVLVEAPGRARAATADGAAARC